MNNAVIYTNITEDDLVVCVCVREYMRSKIKYIYKKITMVRVTLRRRREWLIEEYFQSIEQDYATGVYL